jgi:hypothetical protein
VRVLLLVIGLACVAMAVARPSPAFAKPKLKIAVAPLQGDPGDKVATAVVDALAGRDFMVVGPQEVRREMTRLGLSGELAPKSARKLAARLDVIAVVDGTVGKPGRKRSLHLEVHRRGRPTAGFTLELKSTASDGFRRGVHEGVLQRFDDGGGQEPADDDDQASTLAARQAADDDDAAKRSRKQADDDDDRKRKRKLAGDDTAAGRAGPRDDGGDRRRKRVASGGDDDEPAVRTRKSRKQLDDAAAPRMLARAGAGVSAAQRRLTYDTRGGFTQVPPRVITTAGAGRVEGEIYPFALANPGSGLGGLGFAGAYDKTFGLSIKIPNQAVSAPINQSHFALGARYRFGVGEASSIALGLDYVGRHYIADRSGLMAAVLDAPDVDYAAVAPGIAARTPVTDTITAFGGLDGLLMLEAGPIQQTASYGPATVYGVEATGGVDIAIGKQIGLRVAVEYSQINFSFSNKGVMAVGRDNDPASQDVMGAVDRSIGLAATLGLVY